MTGPRLRARHVPSLVIAIVSLALIGGFAWFASQIPDEVADPDSPTDAIVVLTGGSLRIESGLGLLAAGKAKKLFISGVYRGADVNALLHTSGQHPDWLTCCIVLGYDADNTHGNAAETAIWMRKENFHSLRLVTASYHMPRSLLEFDRAMPEIHILPHPVFPESVPREWWRSSHAAAVMIREYIKYLAALARLHPEEQTT
jgi:uncharacterized SAM-binding protein YcdF (DUF218 family)